MYWENLLICSSVTVVANLMAFLMTRAYCLPGWLCYIHLAMRYVSRAMALGSAWTDPCSCGKLGNSLLSRAKLFQLPSMLC